MSPKPSAPQQPAVLVRHEMPRRAPRFAHRAARSLLARLDGGEVSTDDTIAEQRAAMESAFARLPILPGADVARRASAGSPAAG